jgi:hypothetical protein
VFARPARVPLQSHTGGCSCGACSTIRSKRVQVTQTLFSTDFPLADKILAQKNQQDHFYVVHRA